MPMTKHAKTSPPRHSRGAAQATARDHGMAREQEEGGRPLSARARRILLQAKWSARLEREVDRSLD